MFLAYFFVGATGGFRFDLLQLNASRVGGGFFWPLLVGRQGAYRLAAAGIEELRTYPSPVSADPFRRLARLPGLARFERLLPVPVSVHRRVLFDAIGILVGIGFGARFLLFFAGTEGVASVRMQTELSLAHAIQATWYLHFLRHGL